MTDEITADEYRTAVRVMRYGVGGCGSSSQAGLWTKEADRLDAEADRKADIDALAEHMCIVAFDYDTAWSEACEAERKRFRQYAEAALAKLETDERLRPAVVDAQVVDESTESWATWQDVPEGVQFRSISDPEHLGGIWERHGEHVYSAVVGSGRVYSGGLNAIGPFERAEAGDDQ